MCKLTVSMPCGKELCFFIDQDKSVHCSNSRVIGALSERGVAHMDGNRYFPKDGEYFLEALHDFYWLKGLSVRVF